tara:strand:+ start:5267 stop:5515 length:249 start_codon:yes stop_codon:yes gene_type:complete
MKAKITVGDVEIEVEGLDLTNRQISSLMTRAANLAVLIQGEEEPESRPTVGFSAQVELDPERNLTDVDPEWFDDTLDPPSTP